MFAIQIPNFNKNQHPRKHTNGITVCQPLTYILNKCRDVSMFVNVLNVNDHITIK